jgi:hypothetical protein
MVLKGVCIPMSSKRSIEPARPRYSVRTDGPRGIEEIGTGIDLNAEIAFARRHHGATRQKTWIWDIRTGMTVHRIERGEATQQFFPARGASV